jgi:hypothetical protein
MSFTAQEIRFGEYPSTGSYDPAKVSLSKLMVSVNGATAKDKWAGPLPVAVARPMEQSTAVAMAYPHVIQISPNIFWIFLAENSTAAANRRLFMYTYDKSTMTFSWNGFVTLTLATNQTVRALRMVRYLYTTGSVAVAGSSVAGSQSLWTTDRLAVGGRIGFGTTDPTQVAQWHNVSAIPSNVQMTISDTATVASGTSYVYEELRAVVATTAATALSGGLYIAKGLNPDLFIAAGTTIAAATTTDNIRAVYLLADTALPQSQLSLTAGGLGLTDMQSWQSHSVYMLTVPAATTPRIYKFNMRANLATGLGNGRSWAALDLATGLGSVVGTTSQANNSRFITLGHGPGSGSDCLYFATTTRIARVPSASITSGSTTFVADMAVEIPPGGVNTYAAGSGLAAVEHMSSTDRLVVSTTGAAGIRSYVTKYNTISDPFDHIILSDNKQQDPSTAAGGLATPSILASPFSIWSEDGIAFMSRNTTAANTNQVYAVPLGADASYVGITGEGVISPKINTVGCTKFSRVYVNATTSVGDGIHTIPTEPFFVQVRTSGIDDDSGSWTTIDASGDIGFLGGADAIQFRFIFNMLGASCVPARIHGFSVTYDADLNILPQLEWNLNDSNLADGTVGFTQNAVFSGSTPNMTVNYYRSDTAALVLSQNSLGTTNGTFQWYSGSLWTGSLVPNGLGPNEVGTRRRFVPSAGLPANINVYAQIIES